MAPQDRRAASGRTAQSDSHAARARAWRNQDFFLEGLDALLRLPRDGDPFAIAFAALRKVLTFSQSLVLVESAGEQDLLCLACDPADLPAARRPITALSREILAGKTIAAVSAEGGSGAERPVLGAPLATPDRRGLLLLARAPGAPGFSRDDIAILKRFALLASHALAAREAAQSRRDANLLRQTVDALPVGVAVHDGAGGLALLNPLAKTVFGPEGAALAEFARAGAAGPFEHEVARAGGPGVMLINPSAAQLPEDGLIIATALDITRRKRFERELQHRACHDDLTGLPNRTLIKEMVGRRLSEGARPFALAFIDVDNFKQINDFYSHAVGDLLLLAVAARIGALIGAQDVLARISGDEFLLLIDVAAAEDRIQSLIDGIVEDLRKPFQLEGHEVFSSASVGVSVYPRHGQDYESLRRSADRAMARAKSHKGSVAFFDESMRKALTARMEIEQKLRAAVRGGHFRVAYQSKNNLVTGAVEGFEALARWVDPDGTVYSPGLFVNIANELGLLGNITHIVLDAIARDLARLKRRFGAEVSVSLNVSARQANSPDFMTDLLRRIERTGIGSSLIVELTEEALVSAKAFQACVLPGLRKLGVRISIDDFGAGFSSLSMLSDIDADELKVDRAFITAIHERPRSQDILKAIESVCDALGIKIVAEGVESPEELDYLSRATNMRTVQGFFYGKPRFIEDVLGEGD